jgi:hypothetical protein
MEKLPVQPWWVVKSDGRNEPGNIPAPFAAFTANEESAKAIKSLYESWGLKATIEKYEGPSGVIVAKDGSLEVEMYLKPV